MTLANAKPAAKPSIPVTLADSLTTADNIMIPMRGTARYGAANVSCDVESRVSSDSRTPTDATTGSYADVADSGMHSDRVEVAKSDLANNVSQEAASGNVNGLELAALACISSQASLESNCPVLLGQGQLT